MWVYLYINGKRIRQLAAQIEPQVLIERTERQSKAGKSKTNISAKLSKIFSLVGIEPSASFEIEGDLSKTVEEKFQITDDIVLDRVHIYLSDSQNYSWLTNEASHEGFTSLRNLVRFRAEVSPDIKGEDAMQRYERYEKAKIINWSGRCGEIAISFSTSKEFLISNSPIYQCLRSDKGVLQVEGFAVVLSKVKESRQIEISPIFLGVQI